MFFTKSFLYRLLESSAGSECGHLNVGKMKIFGTDDIYAGYKCISSTSWSSSSNL